MKTLKYYPPLFHFRLTQSKWWLIGGLLAIFSLGIHAEDKLNNRLGIPFKAPEPTGATRLIIGLKVPTQPEGELSGTQSVAEQRNAIEFAKTQFLSELKQSLEVDGLSGAASTVEVKKQFKTIPYLVMEVNPAILSKIEENSQVADVAVDEIHPPTLSDSTVLIGADDVWEQGYTGSGQVVAVLDTGVDKTHPALRGKIVKEACYSTTSTSYEASTVCPNGEESEEGNGAGVACDSSVTGCDHGTHVAGIIAANGSVNGVAKDAQLIAIQVFSRFDNPNYCLGSDSCALSFTSDQIAALEYVYQLRDSGMDIAAVNMSLGSGKYAETCASSMQSIIQNLRSVGIATVVASGNEGYTDGIASPACVEGAISVGASTKSDTVANYSNSADILDLLAPGSQIVSTLLDKETGSKSGTSMAAPHVAAAFALLKEAAPNATVDEIERILKRTGKRITDNRNALVKPRIDLAKALEQLAPSSAEANIEVTPMSYDFGDIIVNKSSDSATITISNQGESNLKIGNLAIDHENFKIATDGCSDASLAAGESCTVTVTFNPSVGGAQNATLQIPSNDPDTATVEVSLTGQGIEENTGTGPTPASCLLYAVHDGGVNNSQLLTIDPTDFAVNSLGEMHKGHDIEALAVHPTTNIIYAASGDKATNGKKGHLYQVDAQTGELISVGSTGFKEIEDLAFSADGNTLWAWAKGDGIITIDLATGVGTSNVVSDIQVEGMALSKNTSTLFYGSVGQALWTYDSSNAQLTEKCTNFGGETEALEIMADDLLLFGRHDDKTFNLHVFDPATCQVLLDQDIDVTPYDDVEGIALPTAACN
jgi:subtilisin